MRIPRRSVRFHEGFWRTVDFASSLTGALLLLPVFAVVALAIVWDDGFPVFFRQTRVGKRGRPFRIWKFRTMRNGIAGIKITAAGDSRVTRVGAWLRRYKVDELPQLWNVLSGSMSLIGPRPEVPEYVDLANSVWRSVLNVRPGITDAASLVYRDEEAILGRCAEPDSYYRRVLLPAKLDLNVKYINSRSVSRDIRLLALTVRYSFFPRGFNQSCLTPLLVSKSGAND